MTDTEIDEFEDFDSPDFQGNWGREDGNSYLDSMWGSHGFRQTKHADDLLVAHRMVQGFVNSFARDGYYRVTFDPQTKTAGTDLDRRLIVITPSPVLDTSITAQEAGRILTGMACHEVSHTRYGRNTAWAVKKAFPYSVTARKLGNLLDDVRIERRYTDDYPGYGGVFTPTLKYIAGKDRSAPKAKHMLNVAIVAIRYDEFTDWPNEMQAHRAYWIDWAERWCREDAPSRVVAAVREGLKYIVDHKEPEPDRFVIDAPPPPPPPPSDGGFKVAVPDMDGDDLEPQEDGDESEADEDARDANDDQDKGPSAPKGDPIEATDEDATEQTNEDTDLPDEMSPVEEQDEAPLPDMEPAPSDDMDDIELGKNADQDTSPGDTAPICIEADDVDDAAKEDGVTDREINTERVNAEETIRQAEEVEFGVDVARSTKGITHKMYSKLVRKSPLAERYIRDALMRSRSGHTDVTRYQKRGRLDSHGLHRVATHDFRVFDRKHAPSPDKLHMWLLIDCSISMKTAVADAASVATVLAEASKHVKGMRLAVFGWSYSFRGRGGAGAARVWRTGEPTTQIAKVADLKQGGTPDGQIMRWARQAILRETRQGERPVILMASDGFGEKSINEEIRLAQKAGITVISVAIGSSINEDAQVERFGKGNVVPWQGSIVRTARPLAAMLGRLLAVR